MADLTELLKRWQSAGVIDETTAQRIGAFESANAPVSSPANRPGALEALLYLGLVVLAVGAFSLFAENWNQLESWARVVALAAPALLLLVVGAALSRSADAQLERGGQAAWLLTVALFAGLFAVVVHEYGLGFDDADDPGSLLLIAASTFLLAVALWIFTPSYPQLLAIAGATVFLGQAVGNWPDEFSQEFAGMTIFAVAIAGLALAEAGWLTPVIGSRILFSVLAIMGPFEAGVDRGPVAFELLAGGAAAAVIAYGVVRASFLVVLVGVLGSFFVLINFIFRHFSDRIGGPMAMMLSGGILIAGVLLLEVYRRRTGRAGRSEIVT